MDPGQERIARLLEDIGHGDRDSVGDLFALVYDELKALAHRQRLRWRGAHSLNTTALVHEVYVKLVGRAQVGASDRAHFRALASRAMRHVLCNHAREAAAEKRGGARRREGLEVEILADPRPGIGGREADLAALGEALSQLERTRPRASRVVECRFFGGMTVEETALAIGASERSVKRDWAMAQAWLHRTLEGQGDPAGEDGDAR